MKTATMDEIIEHAAGDDGYCTSCHEWTVGGVEPDAEGYECPYCGENAVVGVDCAGSEISRAYIVNR